MAIAFKNAENYFIALKCIEIKSSLPTLIMYSEIYSSAHTEKNVDNNSHKFMKRVLLWRAVRETKNC